MAGERLSFLDWAFELAESTARRSTCIRRGVGCVLFNGRRHILATGYNGVAAGQPHCNERGLGAPTDVGLLGAGMVGRAVTWPHACPGAFSASGTNLDGCHAIHAEQNALLQCQAVHEIDIAVVTTAPCVTCTKLLLNTGCKSIVFKEDYPHSEASRDLWARAGRTWAKI